MNDSNILYDNEGFIKVTDKKNQNKRRKDNGDGYRKKEYGYHEKPKHDKSKKPGYGSKTYPKAREPTQTITYEAKPKPDTETSPIKEVSVARIIVPTPTKTSSSSITPKKLINYSPPVAQPEQSVLNTSPPVAAGSTVARKGKALSLKSPSVDPDTIKASKVRGLASEYFGSKLQQDIYEHVADLTDESNKMMGYRILTHTRIDYCLKKIFMGMYSIIY